MGELTRTDGVQVDDGPLDNDDLREVIAGLQIGLSALHAERDAMQAHYSGLAKDLQTCIAERDANATRVEQLADKAQVLTLDLEQAHSRIASLKRSVATYAGNVLALYGELTEAREARRIGAQTSDDLLTASYAARRELQDALDREREKTKRLSAHHHHEPRGRRHVWSSAYLADYVARGEQRDKAIRDLDVAFSDSTPVTGGSSGDVPLVHPPEHGEAAWAAWALLKLAAAVSVTGGSLWLATALGWL